MDIALSEFEEVYPFCYKKTIISSKKFPFYMNTDFFISLGDNSPHSDTAVGKPHKILVNPICQVKGSQIHKYHDCHIWHFYSTQSNIDFYVNRFCQTSINEFLTFNISICHTCFQPKGNYIYHNGFFLSIFIIMIKTHIPCIARGHFLVTINSMINSYQIQYKKLNLFIQRKQ